MDAVRSLQSNAGLASHLGNAWALTGDWGYFFEERERNQAVTAADVVSAAKRYLVPQQCTIAWLVRGGPPAPARPAGRPGASAPWETN